MGEESYERLLHNNRKLNCRECGGRLKAVRSGEYVCCKCGATELDDFGLVRKYLEENGPSSKEEIALATGVRRDTVAAYLRQERLMIVGGNGKLCRKCGKSIASGTLCTECKREEIQAISTDKKAGSKAKTRFMGRKKD